MKEKDITPLDILICSSALVLATGCFYVYFTNQTLISEFQQYLRTNITGIFIPVTAILVLVIYWTPTIIAFGRNKRNKYAISALNLFAGWTFVGWVGALVWSLLHD